MNERELRIKREECLTRCTELNNRAKADNRALTNEEEKDFDVAWQEAGDIEKQIEAGMNAVKVASERDARIEEARAKSKSWTGAQLRGVGGPATGNDGGVKIEYRQGGKLRTKTIRPGSPEYARATPEYNDAYNKWLVTGGRPDLQAALQVADDTKGGYFVQPEQVTYELASIVDEVVVMRQMCRIIPTNAKHLGAVYRTDKATGFVWGTELTNAPAVTDPKWGKRLLEPHALTGYTSPTNDFLQMSEIPASELVNAEMAIGIGEAEETAFCSGDGNGKPLGIFVASDNGLPTTQDVNGGSTTALTYAGFCDMVGKLPQRYLNSPSIAWLCHRDFLKNAWKIVGSTNDHPVLKTEPNGPFFYELMGIPVMRSDFAPNTFTSALYVAVLGDWRYYWIAERPQTQIMVNPYLKQLENKTVFMYRRYIDGMCVRPTAFARWKMST